jgi:uncharacterized membrane protein
MTNPADDSVKLLAQRLLELDYKDIKERERRVIERVAKRIAVSRDPGELHLEGLTLGAKLADAVAKIGGSWSFVIVFSLLLVAWMVVNGILLSEAFDPFPFILLNLFLSAVAALQAPIIMMSQNRQAAKDRLQASHDYEVNLKAEFEIMALHDKLDELRNRDLAELIRQLKGKKRG